MMALRSVDCGAMYFLIKDYRLCKKINSNYYYATLVT